jgi:SAM-dependent methyltransferase
MPEVIATCILCGESGEADPAAAAAIGVGEPFGVSRCGSCTLRWLSPRPDPEEYALVYQHVYYGSDDGERPAWLARYPAQNASQRHERAQRERLASWNRRQVQRLAGQRSAAGSLLEVGAGVGDLLAEARRQGFEVTGIEPSPDAVERARAEHGLDLHCSNLEDYFTDRRFDVVVLSHVLEHFADPVAALKRVHELVAPGGCVLIEVPSQFESLTSRLTSLLDRGRARPSSIYSIHHTYFYGPAHLRRLLRNAGFSADIRSFFPERRPHSLKAGVFYALDAIGDRLGSRGTYLEAVARPMGLPSPHAHAALKVQPGR